MTDADYRLANESYRRGMRLHDLPVRLTLFLPWPPSVNRYWRSPRSLGRVLLSAAGRDYRKRVEAALLENPIRGEPLSARLHVTIVLHAPTRRKYDTDNYLKALLDAMEHAGVYLNDEQIDWTILGRGPVMAGGMVFVEIREIVP